MSFFVIVSSYFVPPCYWTLNITHHRIPNSRRTSYDFFEFCNRAVLKRIPACPFRCFHLALSAAAIRARPSADIGLLRLVTGEAPLIPLTDCPPLPSASTDVCKPPARSSQVSCRRSAIWLPPVKRTKSKLTTALSLASTKAPNV